MTSNNDHKRWRCTECRTIKEQREWLTAPSPFDKDDTLTGCPRCKSVESMEEVCDEPSCTKAAGCGWPSDAGYRRTCFDHSIFKEERDAKQ